VSAGPFQWRAPESTVFSGEVAPDGSRLIDNSAEEQAKQARLTAAVLKAVGVTDPEKKEKP